MHSRRLGCALVLLAAELAAQQPTSIEKAWDDLLPHAVPAPAGVQERAAPENRDFENHFFLQGRAEFTRYSTDFTGQPTISGAIDAPYTGSFNPNGIPYPQVFQPSANRIAGYLDFGTHGWLAGNVDTHFGVRYEQDLTHVNTGAPAAGFLETFSPSRRMEFNAASVEIKARPDTGVLLGRQTIMGSDFASFDGGALTLRHGPIAATLFGGRRFTYFSGPDQRAIGGANVLFRLGRSTSLEYNGLWYVRGTNRAVLRSRVANSWLLTSYLRSYGGAPADFSAQVYRAGLKGSVRVGFFQKLTARDTYYDYTYFARDRDVHNPLLRLYLGPLQPYSQFTLDAHWLLTKSLGAAGGITVRRLNDDSTQTALETSFEDYRARADLNAWKRWPVYAEYHGHRSHRVQPNPAALFDETGADGETSVHDVSAGLGHNFAHSRFGIGAGAYYRRMNIQSRFSAARDAHQSGLLTGAWLRADSHTRLFADYNLDNDFLVFRPSIAHSTVLRVGMIWRR